AAAFQLAIWEIVEESSLDINDFDVTDGVFTAQSAADGVIETANAFLEGLGGVDANFRIDYFQNPDGPDGPGTQDLIRAAPIPLPASAVLLIAGLGGLAFMRSRKRS
ncbi:MAG: VPLPA-CTERM sorting domain-containing protein, partial [Pseudomonadota bacterium]